MFRLLSVISLLLSAFCGSGIATAQDDKAEKRSVPADHAEQMKAGLDIFRRQVRTLLEKHCVECHAGPKAKGDFDLSTRASLLDSGFVENTAEESHLVRLIRHEEEPFMPHKKDRLPDDAIATIARWIDLGAPYDRPFTETDDAPSDVVTESDRSFWSFQPLGDVTPPAGNDPSAQTPIDQFVAAGLAEQSLVLSPAADRRTLIRRAYLDLIGMPPTPEEVAAFVADDDPGAWEHLIDRLLQSDHYGERWARHWMDVARYAESGGFEHDYFRANAYHYRDFLIRAFNDDMPFDQFVSWQLAGDELAPNDPLAMRATGFIGAGVFPSQITEAEFEQTRYDELDDIVTTTGVSFLGLSIGCARCHDHKFDPIPTRDYYRLASSFTKTIRSEVSVPVDPAIVKSRLEQHEQRLTEREQRLRDYEATELLTAFREFLKTPPDGSTLTTGDWRILTPQSVTSTAGTTFEIQPDQSALSVGQAPDAEVITFLATTSLRNVRSVRLEALSDDSLPQRGPGRADNGNFALGNVDVQIQPAGVNADERLKVALTSAVATHQQNTSALSVAASIDDDPVSGWAVDAGGIGKSQAAAFRSEQVFTDSDEAATLVVQLRFHHPNRKHTIGRFRISVSTNPDALPVVDDQVISQDTLAAIATARESGEESSAAWRTALEWFRTTQPRWQALNGEVNSQRAVAPPMEETVQVSSEGLPKITNHADGRGYPHFYPETHVLARGDVNQKQEVATQSFLQVLMPPESTAGAWQVTPPADWTRTSFQRAALANWITDTEHGAGHLAARVIVNRLWQHHFGRGIVTTPNDFGFQGERPTHPELLDWLASRLIENNWKLKPIHRLIMSSAAYRQSSHVNEAAASADPDNTLLWRFQPRRLEAEAIRDSMLAVSGALDPTMYGPGTLDESGDRRSVYFSVQRSRLIPSMMVFDWPEHLVSIGQRPTTTVAPQALLFMNGPQTRAWAEAMAQQINTGDTETTIHSAYKRCFGRQATREELSVAQAFLAQQAQLQTQAGHKSPETAAIADLCQTLFGLNEFIYID